MSLDSKIQYDLRNELAEECAKNKKLSERVAHVEKQNAATMDANVGLLEEVARLQREADIDFRFGQKMTGLMESLESLAADTPEDERENDFVYLTAKDLRAAFECRIKERRAARQDTNAVAQPARKPEAGNGDLIRAASQSVQGDDENG